jgi:8-oxo-dGTP pyrophosphatase MutT (NUDIX family)
VKEKVPSDEPQYGVPKGHRHTGEHPITCAFRELYEETDISIHNDNYYDMYSLANESFYDYFTCFDKSQNQLSNITSYKPYQLIDKIE